MKKLHFLSLSASAMMFAVPLTAVAGWGTVKNPAEVLSSTVEMYEPKTAFTTDGKAFVCWQEPGQSGAELFLMLIDEQGNKAWEKPMQVENFPQASYSKDYSMVTSADGAAVIAWADTRDDESGTGHRPVLYKISQQGTHVWGENGVQLSNNYKYPPMLTRLGDEIYAVVYKADENKLPILARLNDNGKFATMMDDFSGQIAAGAGTDFIRVYAVADQGTMAMRYTGDFDEVWKAPVTLSTDEYSGFNKFPYSIAPDGDGGVAVTFVRNFGDYQTMPVVQHVDKDGNNTFSQAMDVVTEELYSRDNTLIAVNPGSKTIMTAYSVMRGQYALGGQAFSFTGDYRWGDEGKILSTKDDVSGFSYRPLRVEPYQNDTWMVAYVDVIEFGKKQGYMCIVNSNGNVERNVKFGNECTFDYPATNFSDGNLDVLYFNENNVDGATVYTLNSVRVNVGETSGITGMASPTGNASVYDLQGRKVSLKKAGHGVFIRVDENGNVSKVMK